MAAALYWTVALLAGLACTSADLGESSSVEEYPSIVQVENRVGLLWVQQCVGSVLTSYHILSAASCFSSTSSVKRIRAGATFRGLGGVVAEVQSNLNHPSYGMLGNEADLTVVRLQAALTLGATIQQAQILGQGIELPVGLQMKLAGWGTTTGGNLVNTSLRSLDVNLVGNENCLITYIGLETITENMICVSLQGAEGRDFDSRDGGSPLYYSGTTMGVLSFGVPDGNDNYPVVATNIGSYTSWIVETAATL